MSNRFFIIDFETTGLDKESRPIEVGIIVTDHEFALLETYQALIDWRDEEEKKGIQDFSVHERELKAFAVHKIEPIAIAETGRAPTMVRYGIQDLAKKHTVYGRKPILVSDNVQFEWRHLANLMEGDMSMFHYCGWDTSLFLESTGVGDPRGVPHRALADCGRLHKAILEARYATRGLRP